MNFVEAMRKIDTGNKVHRINGYWEHTYLVKAMVWGQAMVFWCENNTASGSHHHTGYQWLPKLADLLADDWQVFSKKPG